MNAPQIDTADELLTTELMLNGVFNSMDKHQLVALVSCLIPSDKSEVCTCFGVLHIAVIWKLTQHTEALRRLGVSAFSAATAAVGLLSVSCAAPRQTTALCVCSTQKCLPNKPARGMHSCSVKPTDATGLLTTPRILHCISPMPAQLAKRQLLDLVL